MSGGPYRYCGRDFSEAEIEMIRALIAKRDPALHRKELSREVCRRLDWRKPDGRTCPPASPCCAATA